MTVPPRALLYNAVEENVPVAGVQYGAISLHRCGRWKMAACARPMSHPNWRTRYHLPLDDLSHPISDTTTIYRNLASASAESASCDSSHCPQSGARSPVGPAVKFDGQDDYITLPTELIQGDDFTFASWLYLRATVSRVISLPFGLGPSDQNRLELMRWSIGESSWR
ncbi:MAG: hypothetical protein R2867_26675 [Caldilineaceae bacterium]